MYVLIWFFQKVFFWVSLKFSYITTRKCAVNNCKQVHVVKLSYSISSALNFRTNFFAFVYESTNRANLVLIENVERFVETRMVTWCVQMWAIWYFYQQFLRPRVGAQGLLYSSSGHTTKREAAFWKKLFWLKFWINATLFKSFQRLKHARAATLFNYCFRDRER